jgi:hypothetical protein
MTEPTHAIPTCEELAVTVDEASWDALRPHLERDAVILVASGLDLAEAGHALASDNALLVKEWITTGKLGKPTAAQVAAWDANRQTQQFLLLIIQPYVLIQEIPRLVH